MLPLTSILVLVRLSRIYIHDHCEAILKKNLAALLVSSVLLMNPPFPEDAALDTTDISVPAGAQPRGRNGFSATNTTGAQNYISLLPSPCVPGEPSVALSDLAIATFLEQELSTPILDELYPHLWAVAKRQGNHIDPLHRHILKRRSVVVSEDAGLHLVWAAGRVFLKPIPQCLVNHQFWTEFLPGQSIKCSSISPVATLNQAQCRLTLTDLRQVTLGFLRSYAFLIQHRSDFLVAKDSGLLPGEYTWEQWSVFLAYFRTIEDDDVGKRYKYGQLRLSRLNWATRIFRPRVPNNSRSLFYELPYWSTRRYVQSTTVPLLFIFAGVSLALSAMQVMLAVPATTIGFQDQSGVNMYSRTFWGFSTAVIVFFSMCWILLLAIPTLVISGQLLWGYLHREKR